MPIGLIIGGIGSVLGAGASIFGASEQAGAAEQAAQLQEQQFQQTQKNLQPYMGAGTNALSALMSGLVGQNGALGPLLAAFNPSNLASTPGYQFALQQGEQAIGDQATMGVGGGNTLRALANYATGLASQTYQQQLQDYMAQQAQAINALSGVSSLGENAAAGVGNAGQAAANAAGNYLTQGAAAQSAGAAGVANSFNNFGSNYLLSSLLRSGGLGGGDIGGGTASLGNYSDPLSGTMFDS